MATFACLSEQRGKVVSREAILNCWPAECGRSDDALTHAIHELREAFEDDPRRPRYIRTVRARGYHLIDATTLQGIDAPRKRSVLRFLNFGSFFAGYWTVSVGVASWVVQFIFPPLDLAPTAVLCLTLTLGAISLVGWIALTTVLWKLVPDFHVPPLFEAALMHIERHRAPWIVLALTLVLTPAVPAALSIATDQRCHRCIAVLPFSYESADPSYSYLSRGLPDELIAVLARVTPIQVLSSTVTFDPKLADLDLKTIAHRLRVAYLVQGRISIEGGEVRIRATLVDASTGKPAWSSEKYQQHLASVFDLYDKVATHLSAELQVAFYPDSQATLKKMQSPSEDAYSLYLQGRDSLRRPAEGNVLQRAVDYFQRAIEEDPQFARAYAGLCESQVTLYRVTRDNAFIEPAKEACDQARELDPSAREVLVAIGRLCIETGEFGAADEAFARALASDPSFFEAQLRLGELRWHEQRDHEAKSAFETAIELQPGNWQAYALYGAFLSAKGNYADAEAQFDRVLSLTPDSTIALANLGAAYMLEGRLQDATRIYERSLALDPNGQTLSNLGLLYYYLRRYEDAVRVMTQASSLAPSDHRVWGNLALAQSYSTSGARASRESYLHAIELGKQRLAIDPSDADALADVATYEAAIDLAVQARADIDKAISLQPDDGATHYLAAVVNELVGDRAAAVTEMQKALSAGFPCSFMAGDARLRGVADPLRCRTREGSAQDQGH
jgi:tetratricopeptide (TPR) repeat protein